MLKALLLLLMNLALAAMAMAQNLVLNGSFEDTLNCEISTQCTLLKAKHWRNPNTATPDTWECDLDRACGSLMEPTGSNAPYFQTSYDGSRHAGIYLWYGPGSSNTREYLMTQLEAPLDAGVEYTVSLWQVRRRFRYAIDHIGAWFGPDSLFEATPNWLSVSPQVRLRHPVEPYLVEGDNWEQLADTFVAIGGEQWMVIGNFDPAGTVDGIDLSPEGSPVSYAYHFIDEVAVVPVETGTGISSAQLQIHRQSDGWWLQWPIDTFPDRLRIYDAIGQLICEERIGEHIAGHRIERPPCAPGVYVLVLTGSDLKLSARVSLTWP